MIAHATCTVSLNHGVNACRFERALGNVGLNLGSEGLNDNQVIMAHAFIVRLNAIAESSAGSLRERLFLKRRTSQNDSNSRYNSPLEQGRWSRPRTQPFPLQIGRLRTARWFLRCLLFKAATCLSSPTEQWQAAWGF